MHKHTCPHCGLIWWCQDSSIWDQEDCRWYDKGACTDCFTKITRLRKEIEEEKNATSE